MRLSPLSTTLWLVHSIPFAFAIDCVFTRDCFVAVDSSELDAVVSAFFEVQVKAGEVIIRQGEDGDNFYIVDEGKCEVFVSQEDRNRLVSSLQRGDYFGELALMYNCPRAATVNMKMDGCLFALRQEVFQHILRSSAQDRRSQYDTASHSWSSLSV